MSDSKAVATQKPKSAVVMGVDRLKSLAERDDVQKRFKNCLGSRGPAFISSMISAVSANAQLAKCEPLSVIGAALVSASMDLPINPSLGFAHIVPYGDTAQFQMGWKGFVQLGMRSGLYKTMNAVKILEGQLVRDNPFTGEIEFQSEATSDTVVGYLFYFKLLNGYEKYTYMTKKECEAHRDRYSAMYKNTGKGPWKTDFDAMALKTCVKRGLSRWGVLSIEMQRAVSFDDGSVNDLELDSNRVSYPDAVPEEKAAPGAKKQSRTSRIIEEQMGEEPPPIESERQPGDDSDAAPPI